MDLALLALTEITAPHSLVSCQAIYCPLALTDCLCVDMQRIFSTDGPPPMLGWSEFAPAWPSIALLELFHRHSSESLRVADSELRRPASYDFGDKWEPEPRSALRSRLACDCYGCFRRAVGRETIRAVHI